MHLVERAACVLGSLLFFFIKEDALFQVTAWVPTVMATPHRPSRVSVPSTRRSEEETAPPTSSSHRLLETLSHWFQGDFDNYRQVVSDRQAGFLLEPRESGGHEHIHCCLMPVTTTTRLAAFYFDGTPQAIFRFRFYRLEPSPVDDTVDTILYTLSHDLEQSLRACPDPRQWPHVLQTYLADHTSRSSSDDAPWWEAASCLYRLPRCEVRWSWDRDAIQHAYVDAAAGGIHAVMVHGEALVESQRWPGRKILIRDQLSLWEDELWIHDRGLDPATGALLYGNHRGIPYRLQRVTHRREPPRWHVTDPELAWTLGRDDRTPVAE
jgi:CpeT/CpcT family (DUF1001)